MLLQILYYFLLWTFVLYWAHRLGHKISWIRKIHMCHHSYISQSKSQGWHWSNIFLYNDTAKSTIDYWITEVLPTILVTLLTQQYWIFAVFYIWAAFFQEATEHNKNFNLSPYLTMGKWHMLHHEIGSHNFGVYTTIWDIVFKTNKHV